MLFLGCESGHKQCSSAFGYGLVCSYYREALVKSAKPPRKSETPQARPHTPRLIRPPHPQHPQTMAATIHVHVGQCGNQLGERFWSLAAAASASTPAAAAKNDSEGVQQGK
jgi:hypothetical protein